MGGLQNHIHHSWIPAQTVGRCPPLCARSGCQGLWKISRIVKHLPVSYCFSLILYNQCMIIKYIDPGQFYKNEWHKVTGFSLMLLSVYKTIVFVTVECNFPGCWSDQIVVWIVNCELDANFTGLMLNGLWNVESEIMRAKFTLPEERAYRVGIMSTNIWGEYMF